MVPEVRSHARSQLAPNFELAQIAERLAMRVAPQKAMLEERRATSSDQVIAGTGPTAATSLQ